MSYMNTQTTCRALLLLALTQPVFAKEGAVEKGVNFWRNTSQDLAKSVIIPERIVFIDSVKKTGEVVIHTLNQQAFDAISYLKVVTPQEYEAAKQLNMRPWLEKAAIASNDEALKNILATANAKVAVMVPKDGVGKWQALTLKEEKKAKMFVKAFTAAPDEAAIVAWLNEGLGYNGVVLVHKGKSLIVGANKDLLVKGVKASVVDESVEKIVVKGAKAHKTSIRFLKGVDNYALFAAPEDSDDKESSLVGAKVILEK